MSNKCYLEVLIYIMTGNKNEDQFLQILNLFISDYISKIQ